MVDYVCKIFSAAQSSTISPGGFRVFSGTREVADTFVGTPQDYMAQWLERIALGMREKSKDEHGWEAQSKNVVPRDIMKTLPNLVAPFGAVKITVQSTPTSF